MQAVLLETADREHRDIRSGILHAGRRGGGQQVHGASVARLDRLREHLA
jgi:hypothetical protein